MQVESEMTDLLVDLFGSARFQVEDRARTFSTYVVPNKAFVDLPEIIVVAEHLVELLETEISSIKASTVPDRDERLAAVRNYKREIRGFLVHERKYQQPDAD